METSQKEIHSKVRQMIMSVIKREIYQAHKMPLVAFASFDFKGKGYIEASDISEDRISFKMPLTKEVMLTTHNLGILKIHSDPNYFHNQGSGNA